MVSHKMVILDGVRYRPEDVPERAGRDEKAKPVSTETAKPSRSRRKKEDGDDGDSSRASG